MSVPPPTVCVFGATGHQGGALAHQLCALAWNVHATVRDIHSSRASALTAAGAHLTEGDWDNNDALRTAMSGCDKLFLCLMPDLTDHNRELRQTANIIRIAKDAGVKQVVASTSLGVSMLEDRLVETSSFMYKHLANKKAIEKAVADAGFLHYTFLRPSFLMVNFLNIARYPELHAKGTWTTTMTPRSRLALLDAQDVAGMATAAFQEPEIFHNRAIGLASDLLTAQETLDKLGNALCRPLKAIFMTDEEIAEAQQKSTVFVNSQSSLRLMEQYVDMEGLAKTISLTPFQDFLHREQEQLKRVYNLSPQ
ncbi:hypothetical protein DL767_004647 [Monosporascus sp. MG133]|nr:hypothetical protein DL767_004647 [Monosporascus sp. MG133]